MATRANNKHGRHVGAHLRRLDGEACDATAQLLARRVPAGEWFAREVSSPGAIDAASGRCGERDAESRGDSLGQRGRGVRRRRSFRTPIGAPSAAHVSGYERLTESEIGNRLGEADRIARGVARGTKLPHALEGIALSGMRGKIGLTMLEDGGWAAAYGHALNTWIAKVEDNPRLPGEAGIEAICQRAFATIGIDSAETASQIFDGVQTVLSRRSDRVGAPETGNVRPWHQEDMAQALGYPCAAQV